VYRVASADRVGCAVSHIGYKVAIMAIRRRRRRKRKERGTPNYLLPLLIVSCPAVQTSLS